MEYGMILLRVVAGLALAAHGSQKLFGSFGGSGPAGTRKFFAGLGFRTPLTMAFIAGLSELGGGLLFAFGLLTPFAALAITVVMLNAIGAVHWKKGLLQFGRRLRVQPADHRHGGGGQRDQTRPLLARPCLRLGRKQLRPVVGACDRRARARDRAGHPDAWPPISGTPTVGRAIHSSRAFRHGYASQAEGAQWTSV
jgi:putative oxidoreductase